MRYRALFVLGALTGCRQILGLDDLPGDGGSIGDGRVTDSNPDGFAFDVMTGACELWTPKPKHFDPCVIGTPAAGLDLTGGGTYVFDTTNNTLFDSASHQVPAQSITLPQSSGPSVSILNTSSFHVAPGVVLRVIGPIPLIIASWSTIDVEGTIDVGSRAGNLGAGAKSGACNAAGIGTDESVASGGSGAGGGAGFHGRGGDGGPGDTPTQNPGGNGAAAVALPRVVRGGCVGGSSGRAGPGDTADPNTIAPGGYGGGAIELAAQTSATVTGTLNAGGQGGGGAPVNSAVGGGGGGSGGYIGIEAPSIVFSGTVAANGGGGGGSNQFVDVGIAGHDASPSTTPAAGGDSSACSVSGGIGSAGPTLDGASASLMVEACGGGGGGGGAGYVFFFGTVSGSGTQSPLAQIDPF